MSISRKTSRTPRCSATFYDMRITIQVQRSRHGSGLHLGKLPNDVFFTQLAKLFGMLPSVLGRRYNLDVFGSIVGGIMIFVMDIIARRNCVAEYFFSDLSMKFYSAFAWIVVGPISSQRLLMRSKTNHRAIDSSSPPLAPLETFSTEATDVAYPFRSSSPRSSLAGFKDARPTAKTSVLVAVPSILGKIDTALVALEVNFLKACIVVRTRSSLRITGLTAVLFCTLGNDF